MASGKGSGKAGQEPLPVHPVERPAEQAMLAGPQALRRGPSNPSRD